MNRMRQAMQTTIFLSIFMLAACCNTNPLMNKSPKERAKVLMNVSAQAVSSLSLNGINGEDAYRQCMKGHMSKKTCGKIYIAMSNEFRSQGLRVSPKKVSDKSMYKRTSAELDRRSYLID
jgi:uncharacterized lipoprotein YajG